MLAHSSETPRPKTGKSGFSKMYICLHKCTRTRLRRDQACFGLGRPRPLNAPKQRHPKQRTHSSSNAKGSRCSKLVKGGTSVDLCLIFNGIDTLDKLSATC